MIKGKNGVTAVVLALASAPIVMTFVQHKNGGLSQGDDSSAVALLEDIKGSLREGLQKFESILRPMTQVEALLKKFPDVAKSLPAALAERMSNPNDKAKQIKDVQAQISADLADVEKLLGFARLYDQGDQAKVPEGIDKGDLDASIDDLVNKLFPKQPSTAYNAEPEPRKGDLMFGCGEPGCEGCGGRKVFEFNENDQFGGKPLFSLGSFEASADSDHFIKGLSEELKGIFGDGVRIVQVGGQRNTDPLQGLVEALEKTFTKK